MIGSRVQISRYFASLLKTASMIWFGAWKPILSTDGVLYGGVSWILIIFPLPNVPTSHDLVTVNETVGIAPSFWLAWGLDRFCIAEHSWQLSSVNISFFWSIPDDMLTECLRFRSPKCTSLACHSSRISAAVVAERLSCLAPTCSTWIGMSFVS